ncbi:MAG TPA: glycosyl transferase family 1, partial [Asanoa sp.]|nr:glycosyl transferase family 1 [Asanoa sp.]
AGNGEVFRAEDLDDFVRAVGLVLADPGRYRAVYDDPELLASWTWEHQATVLDDLYRTLVPDAVPVSGGAP